MLRTGDVDNDADAQLQLPTRKDIRMHTKALLKTILGLALGTGLTVAAWAAPAVVEKGSGGPFPMMNIYSEGFVYDCFGVPVVEEVTVTYNYHQVQTPNENVVYHDLFMHFTGSMREIKVGEDGKPILGGDGNPVLVPEGMTWTLRNNVSPYVIRIGKGMMEKYTAWSKWVSETGGPTITLRHVFHATVNAKGELIVTWEDTDCWQKD